MGSYISLTDKFSSPIKSLTDTDFHDLAKSESRQHDTDIHNWDSQITRTTKHEDPVTGDIIETVYLTNKITFKRKKNTEFNLEYSYKFKIKPLEECPMNTQDTYQENDTAFSSHLLPLVPPVEEKIHSMLPPMNNSDKKLSKINQTQDWISKIKKNKVNTIKKKYNLKAKAPSSGGTSTNNGVLRRSNRHKIKRAKVGIYQMQTIEALNELVVVPNLIGTKDK